MYNFTLQGILAGINIFNKFNYCIYFLAIGIFLLYYLREPLISEHFKNLFLKMRTFRGSIRGIPRITELFEVPLIKEKKLKYLYYIIISGIIGIVIATLPVMFYCIYNDCMADMIFSTFTVNFSYVGKGSFDLLKISNMFKSYSYIIFIVIISLIIILFMDISNDNFISIGFLKKIDKNMVLFCILSSVSLILILIIGGEPHKYYMIVLLPFVIPFFVFVIDDMQKNFNNKAMFGILTLICFMVISFATGRNILLTNFSYTEREARKVKEVLNEYIDIDSSKKMLCIGFGSYYYNYLDLLPNQKYFHVLGIPYDNFKKPIDSLYKNIQDGKSDIVIYCPHDEIKKSYGNLFDVALSKKYVKILQMSGEKEVYILNKYDKRYN